MTFYAGQKLRASDLNAAAPLTVYATADVSKSSSTTFSDVTGFSVSLEANALYVWDCYLAYFAGATGDLKVAWSVPTGTTGHWGVYGLVTGSTASAGSVNGQRAAGYGDANFLAIGGSDSFSGSMLAVPRGYIDTDTTAGSFQLRYGQNTSSGTASGIRAGAWLRVTRVG